jgi:hypothetical protein
MNRDFGVEWEIVDTSEIPLTSANQERLQRAVKAVQAVETDVRDLLQADGIIEPTAAKNATLRKLRTAYGALYEHAISLATRVSVLEGVQNNMGAEFRTVLAELNYAQQMLERINRDQLNDVRRKVAEQTIKPRGEA